MLALIRPFTQLCLFKIGPQHLPASLTLLAITLIAHTIIQVLGFTLVTTGIVTFSAGITATLVLCALTGTLLHTFGHPTRLIQTLTALAGTTSLIWIPGLPLMGWLAHAIASDSDATIAELLIITLLGWNLTVQGNIFRHALSVPLFLGLLISIIIFFITTFLLSLIPMQAITLSST